MNKEDINENKDTENSEEIIENFSDKDEIAENTDSQENSETEQSEEIDETYVKENSEDALLQETEKQETEAENEQESSEFIAEFAPEPMKIPNYNSEKEQKKHHKAREKNIKKINKKKRRSHKLLLKVVMALKCILMFLLLFSVVSLALTSILIRVSTSEYAIENSIRNNHPENFIIGKIENPEKLNLKKSSQHASIADILRDNAMGITTYSDIALAVNKSTYSEFIAKNARGIIANILYGEKYNGIQGKDVSAAIRKNISYIKLVTEIELGESACDEFGEYVDNSHAFDEISPEAISKLHASEYTDITEILLSIMVLACMVIAVMLLVVITAMICPGHAHTVIGWSCMLGGAFVASVGFLVNPSFNVKSAFIRSVYQAILSGFHHSALVYGCAAFAIGFIVFIIGHAMSEPDYEEDE